MTIVNDWPVVTGRDTAYRQYIEKEPVPVDEGTGIIGTVCMLEFAQGSLLLGLGTLVGYLLAGRLARRDFDDMNRRLDELRIEIRQLPTIEISAPVDLSPITTMIKTLEIRIGALSQRLLDSPRRNIGQDRPKVLRTEVFKKKDDPLT